jgi:hypothetical protein
LGYQENIRIKPVEYAQYKAIDIPPPPRLIAHFKQGENHERHHI